MESYGLLRLVLETHCALTTFSVQTVLYTYHRRTQNFSLERGGGAELTLRLYIYVSFLKTMLRKSCQNFQLDV
jgi:hypothetical protein